MKKLILLSTAILLLSPWIASIVHCEIMTARYADDHLLAACSNNMVGRPETLKILDYKPFSYCKAYAKTAGCGNVFIPIYSGSFDQPDWNVVYWDTVWSEAGNADGFIWPYIR